jgi:hypothetical protein
MYMMMVAAASRVSRVRPVPSVVQPDRCLSFCFPCMAPFKSPQHCLMWRVLPLRSAEQCPPYSDTSSVCDDVMQTPQEGRRRLGTR